jgi:predicted enzyme related to lactoylglutathione lyase
MDILPLLTYGDLTAALEQLEAAFGLEPMICARDEHAGHGWVYIRVDDAVAHLERARAAGAEILDELHAIPGELGHRGYSARDREGKLWTFGSASIER